MHYTTLGNTGLRVSVAGLGCGGNSRIGLGSGLGEAQSVALVREALDLGVNFLDTANAYETEGVVGKAIKGRPRDSVVISTKSHASSAAAVGLTSPAAVGAAPGLTRKALRRMELLLTRGEHERLAAVAADERLVGVRHPMTLLKLRGTYGHRAPVEFE